MVIVVVIAVVVVAVIAVVIVVVTKVNVVCSGIPGYKVNATKNGNLEARQESKLIYLLAHASYRDKTLNTPRFRDRTKDTANT